MPDPSNPTARVMDVLNFLGSQPGDSFTLAQIARAVGLSNGSAHRLLTTMAAGQFLTRHKRHRTYSLGLALVALGQAAIASHRNVDIARREAARLAAELGVQCSANAVVDDEIVVLVKEGIAQSHAGLTRVGERRPLAPPVGLCHVAWAGEAAIDAYLARAEPALPAPVRQTLLAAFPLIRARGFAAAANGPAVARMRAALMPAAPVVRDGAWWARLSALVAEHAPAEVQLVDLSDALPTGVSYMAAPVFSPAGTVAFALVLTGFPTGLDLHGIATSAERLCAAAAAVTDETHGRHPPA